MNGASLCNFFAAFTKAHKVFDWEDEHVCHKLCVVAWHYHVEKAKDLVKRAGDMPVLYSYGSDGTPMLTRSVATG
jgi:hypothetical protein